MKVEAFIYGKKIGSILYKNGRVYFEYDKTFKDFNLEISPLKLPISKNGVYTNTDDNHFEGLAGVFYDNLPDKFGSKIINRYYESKNIPAYNLNVLQKLMFIADKSIGAIEYFPQEHSIDKQAQQVIELQNFYEMAKKVLQGDESETINSMLLFMDSASSAGGARAKAVIGWDKENKKMINGLRSELAKGYEHYLIKFDIQNEQKQSSNFTKLEFLYMSMAQETGIDIPTVELIEHNNLFHYLIKRFDRVENEKIHIHSVAGLTHTNFNLPAHYSYDELFRLTRYLTGEQKSVQEQYRRMVFNILARNQDDHAKNFAFMMDKQGRWNITPAYDITYANGGGYTSNHQFSLNGKVNDFNKNDLLDIASKHSISSSFAKEQIALCTDVLDGFDKRALDMGINKSLVDVVVGDFRRF